MAQAKPQHIGVNSADADILTEIRAGMARIEAGQREILALLQRNRDGDVPKFSALLKLAFAQFKSTPFTCNDLVEYAALDGQDALRSALARIGTTRAVGNLIKRCATVRVDGLSLVFVRPSSEGLVWRIEQTGS
jgi:hypothetical protein